MSNIYGGAPGVKLHIYKVLNDQGDGTIADIINALISISLSYQNGIISMSLGLYDQSNPIPSFALA